MSPVRPTFYKNKNAFSLLEVLIAMGILGILSLGLATLFSQQQKDLKAIFQKSDSYELKTALAETMNDINVCSWQLAGKVIDVSTTTVTVKSPTVLNLSEIRIGLNNASALLAKAGQILPNSQNGIIVANVFFRDIFATGNPNLFKGIFEVQFDPASLVRPLKPVQVSKTIRVSATDPATAKTILSCGNRTGDFGGIYYTVNDSCAVGNPQNSNSCSCPASTISYNLDNVNGELWRDIHWCAPDTLSIIQNFGGLYYMNGAACTVGNPFNGGVCSCPVPTTAVKMDNVNGEGGLDIYWCNGFGPGKLGGLYMKSGGVCKVKNPLSGDTCTCPTGFTANTFSNVNGQGGVDIFWCSQ